MDSQAVVIVLRLLHIVGGIFWVGATLVVTYFLLPAQRDAGPEGGRYLQLVMGKHALTKWLSITAPVTVLSGALLMWRDARLGGFMASRPGMGFSLGATAGILAAIVGMGVAAPTGRKILALGQRMASAGGPPDAAQTAEMQRLLARSGTAGRIAAVLLLISAAFMATARYW